MRSTTSSSPRLPTVGQRPDSSSSGSRSVRTIGTGRSPCLPSVRISRPSTPGDSKSLRTCRASSSRCSWRTGTKTGWSRAANPPTWPGACRTRSSRSIPTPATVASSSTTSSSCLQPSNSSPPSRTGRARAPQGESNTRKLADMKAYVVERYGKDSVRAADVPEPQVGARDVFVRVSAVSINPLDKMVRNGEFKRLLKYRPPFILGHDVAGVVTEAGTDVRAFTVGDEVYARPRDLRIGTLAEFIAIDADDVALKPRSLSFDEAGAVPLVALAAWQTLVDLAHVEPGQKVLVHAGAGGLGSTVIQVAKHLGAYVATTAHTDDVERARALGADEVIDYNST